MPTVHNAQLSIDFELSPGIAITGIHDLVNNRSYLTQSSLFFEFAIDDGPPRESDTGLSATLLSERADGSGLTMLARTWDGELEFQLDAALAADENVAYFKLTAINPMFSSIFLRVVLPKIQGVTTPNHQSDFFGTVPSEAGYVARLFNGRQITLGMPFNNYGPATGLPTARNNMELASIFDGSVGGGVFFCDVDGNLDDPNEPVVPPLQFNLSANGETVFTEVAGFWIGNIPPKDPLIAGSGIVELPRLAIGVHPTGDWHEAVDFYTAVHRPHWQFPTAPAWFRDAAAIYCPVPAGGGGIYLDLPSAIMPDGAIWNSWGGETWRSGPNPNGPKNQPPNGPLQISPAGFTPAGSPLVAIQQNTNQVTVFASGMDGAVWATWETNDGPWTTNRNGLIPARITPPGFVSPGAPLACGLQNGIQWNVFFVNANDGSIWVTWTTGDSGWTDGRNGRPGPAMIAPPGYTLEGAHLAAANASDSELDLFVIRNDGAIWVQQVVGFGEWSSGVPITLPKMFPTGAPLVAIQQNDSQLNVFAVDHFGAIQTVWKMPGASWQGPVAVTRNEFAAAKSFLAAAKQSDTQLDVFVVRGDGSVWVIWEQGDGEWSEGAQIAPPDLSIERKGVRGGFPLAVAKVGSDQLNVFFVGSDLSIQTTFVVGTGPWTDGVDGRPGPIPVTPPFSVPFQQSGLAAVARSGSQVDVVYAVSGRIQSFLDLPIFLGEAQALGTNIVYLVDYWEGADQGGDLPYANKGDYIPRSDLGGEDALRAGIQAIHDLGGRVVMYVEPFIIYMYSQIGMENGAAWAGRDDSGNPYMDYPPCFDMVSAFAPWQRQVVEIAKRLVGYGADGIFLDSYAWQMNRPMKLQDGTSYSALEYSLGVLSLVDQVRSAIQQPNLNPEAVVMGETTAGPVAHHWDGGLSADLGFGNVFAPGQETLTASPVRYGIPEVHLFGNGNNVYPSSGLKGLHQVYAAGHGLALCSNFGSNFISTNVPHIWQLVKIRMEYADALIHGRQINQPRSDNGCVVAYQYLGSEHRMIVIVNLADMQMKANITIPAPDPGGVWRDLLTDDRFTTQSGVLRKVVMKAGVGGIRVLRWLYPLKR